MTQAYDIICIGGGSGGIATANRAAQYGARVAVIEAGKLGGTCVNVGCVPKKVMWYAAHHAEAIAQAGDYGFDVQHQGFNWGELVAKRQAYIARLNGLYEQGLSNNGVDYISGYAQFVDANTVAVNGQHYRAARIVIATGGQPIIPKLPGAELGISSDGFFALSAQPRRAVVVGAGYIAVELASLLHALGTETTLVVRKHKPLRRFDDDLGDALMEDMLAQGIRIVTGANVSAVRGEADGDKQIDLDTGETLYADSLLWAIGRRANTAALNLAAAGVAVRDNGSIPSDAWEETNVQGIYAIGDSNGKAELTPVAIAAGRRLADRAFNGMAERKLDYQLIPTVIFTHPPIATVGRTEAEALAEFGAGNIKVYKSRFKPMSHAFAAHPPATLVKLIVQGEAETVVGVHAIGPGVDEMLQGFAVAMNMGATKAQFDDTIAIHPTLAEELVTLR